MLSVSDEYVEDRLSEMEITFSIYKYGEEDPISELYSNPDDKFSDWLDEMTSIVENNVIKYDQFITEGKKDKFPNIKKVVIDDFVVYVGRDSLSNDHLTFNMSHPEDIWMHAKGVPGSHVVIRVRENLPTKEVIRKAAELAVKNSKAKDDKTFLTYLS